MADRAKLRELADADEPRAGFTSLFFLAPGDERVTELLLVRHAQIAPGHDLASDPPLTGLGQEQAEVLAAWLGRDRLDGVFASPSQRARQTAEAVARAQSLSVQVLEALADVKVLRPLDRPLPELLAAEFGPHEVEPRLERMGREMSWDALSPFVEPSAAFRTRISTGIDEAISRHPGQRIVVVTHGPVIAGYLAALAGTPRDFFINPRLTSITRILARGTRRTIDYVNTTPHFEA